MKICKKEINIHGQRVVYYQLGAGDPVLFLHGGRVSALTFKPFLIRLAEEYTVIAPDIPGYGQSSTPTDVWSFVEYGYFFKLFLAALGIRHSAVIGYSMGGGIALSLAAQSSSVNTLVLIDASGVGKPSKSSVTHNLERFSFYVTHPLYLPIFLTLLVDYLLFLWKHRRSLGHIRRIRNTCLTTSYEKMLSDIEAQVLILWGDDDSIYPMEMAYILQRKLQSSEVTILPGTHDWLAYNPSIGIPFIINHLNRK